MSSFNCEYCGKAIIDSCPNYSTRCPHYPNKPMTVSKFREHAEWLKTLDKAALKKGKG